MTPSSPASPRLKLDRAREHRAAVKSRSDEAYRVVGQPDPAAGRDYTGLTQGWRWVARVSEPEKIGPIIGDCIYNLRSSLDQMVRTLGERTGLCTNSDDFSRTSFPIFESDGGFANDPNGGFRQLRCICTDAQRAIKAVQPYLRRKKTPQADPLWILNQLSNRDKHNALLTAGYSLIDVGSLVTKAENVQVVTQHVAPRGAIKDGDILASVQTAIINRRLPSELQMTPNFPVEVVFDEAVTIVKGQAVLRVLDELIADAEAILTTLEVLC